MGWRRKRKKAGAADGAAVMKAKAQLHGSLGAGTPIRVDFYIRIEERPGDEENQFHYVMQSRNCMVTEELLMRAIHAPITLRPRWGNGGEVERGDGTKAPYTFRIRLEGRAGGRLKLTSGMTKESTVAALVSVRHDQSQKARATIAHLEPDSDDGWPTPPG